MVGWLQVVKRTYGWRLDVVQITNESAHQNNVLKTNENEIESFKDSTIKFANKAANKNLLEEIT